MTSEATVENLDSRLTEIEGRFSVFEESLAAVSAAVGVGSNDELDYPEPVAYSLAREKAAGSYHERFFSLLDAGEASIKYTAALALALRGDQALVQGLGSKPITLGKWVSVLRSAGDAASMNASTIAPAVEALVVDGLRRSNGKPTSAARFMFGELVEIRNLERGHGSTRTEGVYEELYRRNAETLHDCLRAMTYLKLPLAFVDDVDVAGEYLQYHLRLLAGPSPMGRIKTVMTKARIRKGETCIWDHEDTFVSLGGLMVYQTCPVCQCDHTFFLEQAGPRTTRYHSYMGNHRFDAPPMSWATP